MIQLASSVRFEELCQGLRCYRPSLDTYVRVFLAMELGDLFFWLEVFCSVARLDLIEWVRV